MATPTHTQTDNTSLPDAHWMYDRLMAEIEPDLTSANIGKLDALYARETPEEHTARLQQYAAAFLIFERALADVEDALWADVYTWQRRMEEQASGTPFSSAM